MLNPALCTRPFSHWLVLKSMLSHWLMTPVLVILALTALSLVPWIFPKLPWKQLIVRLAGILFLIYFTATSPLTISLASKGLVAFLPDDPETKADAIVVLGRGYIFRPSRVEAAAKLWQDRRAPLIFASGLGDGTEILQQLKAAGIPQSALAAENCSRTTEENAMFTTSVLKPQGVKKILLVTDPLHMMRSLLTFRSLGFQVFPHPSLLPPDLATSKKAMMVFYEYLGLVSYGLKGYLLPALNAQGIDLQVAKLKELRSALAN